jgi:hypothetical protein
MLLAEEYDLPTVWVWSYIALFFSLIGIVLSQIGIFFAEWRQRRLVKKIKKRLYEASCEVPNWPERHSGLRRQ